MTGQRIALIVAIDQYQHPGLRQLVAPAADAEALAGVLADRDRGGFDVEVLHNVPAAAIAERLEDVLTERQPSDLVVLHFSCHGLKDDAGELYLAATNTVPTRLASTAVDTVLVNRLMRRSRARRVILLLDCCYGGAFERGVIARAGGDVDVGDQFTMDPLGGGRGRAIITASSAMEYAFEGARLAEDAAAQPSMFTAALVEGLTTGDADRDNDGHVTLGELYDYVYDRVRARSPHQTPCKWEFGLQGELYLARNPHRRIVPGRLPPELTELTEHPHADVRLTAVQLLERAARESDLPRAAAARRALNELADDDSRRVFAAASTALQQTGLRLSVPSLDLGQVTVGETAQSSAVALEGPPLALEAAGLTVTGPITARLERASVSITWTPDEPGGLEAAVTVSGPAGEVRLPVTGYAAAPAASVKPADEQPRQEKPAVERPTRPSLNTFATAVLISGPAGEVRLPVTGHAAAPAASVKPADEQPRQEKPAVERPTRPPLGTVTTAAEALNHPKPSPRTPPAAGGAGAAAERAPDQARWRPALLRGVLAVLFALFPLFGSEPVAVAVTFGFYAIIDSIVALVLGWTSRCRTLVVQAVASLIAGLAALFLPVSTPVAPIIGAWGIVLGATEIINAFSTGRPRSPSWRWLLGGGGTVMILWSIALITSGLLWIVGGILLVFGVMYIVWAFGLRRMGKAVSTS